MRKLLGVAAAVLMSSSAFAADLGLTKAPPAPLFAGGAGFYWGIGTYGGVASSSLNGSGLLVTNLVSNNVEAAGGGLDGAIGYINGNTSTIGFGNWYRLEAEGSYQNIQGAIGGNSVASRWAATQEADVGADVLAFFTSILPGAINWPTLTPPNLPASNIAVGVPKQYVGVEVREFGIDGSIGGKNGTSIGIAPGVKTGFIYPTLGANGKPNGGAIDLWASVTWNTRGATIGNVFAANGQPLTFNAGTNMGTTYLVGIRADLAFR
jgi:hypothetical protein